MVVLRIEHTVPDFEVWKKEGFDADPLDRQASGVVLYKILRPVDDPKRVMIDLEFNTADEAEAMLARLTVMWGNVKERFGWEDLPTTRTVEVVESKQY